MTREVQRINEWGDSLTKLTYMNTYLNYVTAANAEVTTFMLALR